MKIIQVPVPPEDTPLVGRVRVWTRKHKTGARSFRLVWHSVEDGQRARHSESAELLQPGYTRGEYNDARRRVRELAGEKTRELRSLAEAQTGSARKLVVRADLRGCPISFDAEMGEQSTEAVAQARLRVVKDFCEYARSHETRPTWTTQLSHRHTAAWARRRASHVAPSTCNTDLSHLQAFLDWLWERGNTLERLTVRRQRVRVPEREPVIASDDAVRAVVAMEAPEVVRLAVWLLAATGQRQGTLLARTVGDWDGLAHMLEVRAEQTERTKLKARTFALGPATGEKIEQFLASRDDVADDEPLLPGLYYTRLNRILKPHRLSPHSLRRWFCATLERLETPDYIIRVLMGHAKAKTRRRYAPYRVLDGRKWLVAVEDVLLGTRRLD